MTKREEPNRKILRTMLNMPNCCCKVGRPIRQELGEGIIRNNYYANIDFAIHQIILEVHDIHGKQIAAARYLNLYPD